MGDVAGEKPYEQHTSSDGPINRGGDGHEQTGTDSHQDARCEAGCRQGVCRPRWDTTGLSGQRRSRSGSRQTSSAAQTATALQPGASQRPTTVATGATTSNARPRCPRRYISTTEFNRTDKHLARPGRSMPLPTSLDTILSVGRWEVRAAWAEKRPPAPPEGSPRPSTLSALVFVGLTTVLAFPWVLGAAWVGSQWAGESILRAAIALVAILPSTYAVGLVVVLPIAVALSGLHPPAETDH